MKRRLKMFGLITVLFAITVHLSSNLGVYASEIEAETVKATDIIISNHESTLEVGETLTLSATVFPSDSDEQTITYKSLNEAVATVTQTGEIKGIASGKVKIQLSVGAVKKEIELNIKVSAKGININNNYMVLKLNQTKEIVAFVTPENATEKNLAYSSSDTNVATVSENGTIKAVGCGSTSVIVKSADAMAAITVIVADDFEENKSSYENQVQTSQTEIPETVYANAYPIITKEILTQLYESKNTLHVLGNNYSLQVNGAEIKNTNNKLNTDIQLIEEKNNIYFALNQEENLCGNITVSIEGAENYKYLYLYNKSEGKYKLLDYSDLRNLELNSPGKYMLTNSKITYSHVLWIAVIISVIILLILLITYIVYKRKYWFW